jgi:hypothetical protein
MSEFTNDDDSDIQEAFIDQLERVLKESQYEELEDAFYNYQYGSLLNDDFVDEELKKALDDSKNESENKSKNGMEPLIKSTNFSKEFFADDINSSLLSTKDKIFYQKSDKVILPLKSLEYLANSNSDLYVLRVTNPKTSKYTFVCASSFTAPIHKMYVPSWVLHTTDTHIGDKLYADLISVPIITHVTIKVPKIFSKISNSQSIIEYSLRNHSILFLQKKIQVKLFDKIFDFEIISLKPANIGNITNADVNLELIEE